MVARMERNALRGCGAGKRRRDARHDFLPTGSGRITTPRARVAWARPCTTGLRARVLAPLARFAAAFGEGCGRARLDVGSCLVHPLKC